MSKLTSSILTSSILVFLLNAFPYSSWAQSNLEKFKSQSPYWQALEVEKEAIQKRYEAMDLEVAPQLDLEMAAFRDNRKALLVLPVKQEELYLSARLSKYFSTGTTLELLTDSTNTAYRTMVGTNHLGSYQLSLSQSLWRDFFGQRDEIRRNRNRQNYELQLLQIKQQQAQLILNYEQILWDYIVSQIELRLRQESLRRWTDIEKWMKGRYRRLAAELVDVKQISATRILREIQVKTVLQRLKNLKRDLNRVGGESFSDHVILAEGLLEATRDEMIQREHAYSLQALILEKTAQVAEQDMLRTNEEAKPDLKLSFAVGRRGIDDSAASAWLDAYDVENHYTRAALTLSTPLDFSLIKKARQSAKLSYEAAEIRKTQSLRTAQLEWDNLQGQIEEHYTRIQLLKELTQEQRERNEAERKRFLNGRSTSLQVVTAEQEALDAELTLKTTQADFKKLLAQYRLFDVSN